MPNRCEPDGTTALTQHRVLDEVYKAIQATAPNGVCKGDKESPDTTAMYNDTHVTDIVEVGGAADTGADTCHEVKVKAVTTATHLVGKGTHAGGGSPATNGHIFGFGCTYDKTLREVKGVKERGRQQDGPFNHETGHGWAKGFGPPVPSPTDPQKIIAGAQYYDALHNKNNKVTLWLVEPTGAIPTPLGTDNQGARDLSYNPEHHDRTKHIQRRHFWIRETVEDMELCVPLVSTHDNYADFLTKPLAPKLFFALRALIMNEPCAYNYSGRPQQGGPGDT